jgi:methylated-DNA-[protein]-cysteine S-methyltransferase
MNTTDFQERVYALCSRVPAGRVTTYGEIAMALNTRAYQAVGQALRRNPYAPVVPCHRVVASDGSLGGFCGETTGDEPARKKRLLREEGVRFEGDTIADFDETLFRF